MGAWRRGGAFCNGIVCTACRGGCFFRMKVCKRIFGSRWWSPSASRRLCRVQSRYGYPARESLWSPNGVAKIMQGAKPVRLAAEAFLLFVQKEPKYAWGCAPRPPNAKLRLDTNDVNIVRTAPQIRSQGACGAFYFGFCRDRIKNQPYKRRLAPDPGGRRPSGRGVPTRYGSLGRSPE